MREFLIAPKLGLHAAATIMLLHGAYLVSPAFGAPWYAYAGTALMVGIAAYVGGPAMLQIIKYHIQLRRKRLAKRPKPGTGDGGFETESGIDRAGLFDPNIGGVPIGKINGKPFFYNFTHALVNAPAGTQKTVAAVIPSIVHGYRVRGQNKHESTAASAVIIDLKRELRAMTARARKELHGQQSIVLDPADAGCDSYNSLDLVMDCLQGRLPPQKAITFSDIIALTLEPEPESDAKNRFWRAGPRGLMNLAILDLCALHPERATLPEVARVIRDPAALEALLEECLNSDAVGGELSLLARDIAAQGKYLDDFRTGASLALKAFSPAGELAWVAGHSTFRWADLKRERKTVYVCASLSESRAFKPWLRLIAECSTLELEFAPGNVPVHFCLEEATNIAFDIASKLTALRSAGVRAHIVFQERAEVERVFGKQAMETIYGEVDCEQYFGISDHNLARDLEAKLGTVEAAKPSFSQGENPWDAFQQNAGYQRKPLMSAYELMYRMPPQDQIVFIRSRKLSLRPIYCQKLTYDDVKEWLDALDDNPVEGGKLKGPPTIGIRYLQNAAKVCRFRRTNAPPLLAHLRRAMKFLPPLWAGWGLLWLSLGYYAAGSIASTLAGS